MNRKKKESRNRFFLDTAVVLENPGFQFDYKIATKGGRNGHLEGPTSRSAAPNVTPKAI